MNVKLLPDEEKTHRTAFLINRNFTFLLAGRTVSGIGDNLFNTILVLWIVTLIAAGQPWSPLAISGLLASSSIPTIVAGPIAGVFVDRWRNKRRIMLWMDILNALLMFLLLAMTAFSLGFAGLHIDISVFWQLALLYLIVFLSTILVKFAEPSFIALSAEIVEESQFLRSSGLIQAVGNITLMIGPPLGAFLFFAIGLQWAIALNALTFLVSFVATLAIRVPYLSSAEPAPTHEKSHFWKEVLEGLRFYFSNRVLTTVICTGILVLLGAGAMNTLGIFFVIQNLHTPSSFYGMLNGALGIGLILGSLLASTKILSERVGVARTFWLGLVLWGGFILVYARMTSFLPALILLVLLGVMNAAFEAAYIPLILQATPRNFTGRIFSTLGTVFSFISLFSVSIAGYLDGTVLRDFHAVFLGLQFGPVDTIFTGTGLLAILGGLYAMSRLRQIPTQPSREEEE
ncbi:MAG TPA: MFS transporter [Ktedonobacteraceae bacterium]|jgi:MFS family permease